MILERCQGIDTNLILDDQGDAQKTISCENSFRRGTLVTPEGVWKAMEELYRRLPRLLNDRRDWSKQPSKAYPTTIRLTARTVDQNLQRSATSSRRPFVTRSKQVPFRGKELMNEADSSKQSKLVEDAVRPLVQSLVLHSPDPGGLNVTRLSIAVTNFQDVSEHPSSGTAQQKSVGASQIMAAFATQRASQISTSQKIGYSQSEAPAGRTTPPASMKRKVLENSQSIACHGSSKKQRVAVAASSHKRLAPVLTESLPSGIDPATLAELPPDMVNQIVQDYKNVVRNNATKTASKAKPAKIDDFFRRK
jgi:impB/mucB/samB family C-terminal domain